jgi:hypothetical protein
MKKRYIHPAIAVIKYDLCQPMLTASMPLSDVDTSTQFGREGFFSIEEDDPISFILNN